MPRAGLTPIAFLRDERGGVAITTAMALMTLLIFTALSVDAGVLYIDKRKQQMATDFAALAAASNITRASSAASASVASNGFAASDIATDELGTYAADPTIPAAQRFSTSWTATPNAVRVTMRRMQPYLFGSFIGPASAATTLPSNGAVITTRSIAAVRNVAAFSLGSGLVSLDGGIANGVLGSLLGGNLSLSAMDYQSLAGASINLFAFSNALAARAHVTAGTYGALATGTVPLPAALGAVADSARNSQASAALAAILAAAGTSAVPVRLGTLINYGPYGTLALGATAPVAASVSALDIVSALVQVANGTSQVQTPLAVSLPGVLSASLKLQIGEPPVGTSLVTMGPQGTTLTTAQTRLRLSLQLAGTPPASVLTVPIVMSVASGTASLNAVQCTGGTASSSVQVGVTPGLVDAWVGTASDTDLAAAAPLAPPAAPLLNLLGVLTVSGQSHASIANPNATPLSFSYSDMVNGNRKTASVNSALVPLTTSLLGGLQLSVSVLGFTLIDLTALKSSIALTMTSDASPIDTILFSALAVLGVSVGNATVWVSGVQCGQSVLVN